MAKAFTDGSTTPKVHATRHPQPPAQPGGRITNTSNNHAHGTPGQSPGLSVISRNPRGITLIEVTVAAVVLSALLLLLGQAVGWVAAARRQADRRQIALLEASNVLEQITALDFDEIDGDQATKTELAEPARGLLGADALRVDVQTDDEVLGGKRILIEVRYGETNEAKSAVRLTAWVYNREAP